MQTIAVLNVVEQRPLTTPSEKLIKIGVKIVCLAPSVIFQMVEVAIPRELFPDILRRVDRLRRKSTPV